MFAGLGIRRVRITGGEPTVRRDIDKLVAEVVAVPGIEDVAMTTNGHHLGRMAESLAAAGLSRINLSLDTLQPERFSTLTRGGHLDRVLEGFQAALNAGLVPIKINCVLLQGENEDEVEDLVHYFSQWPQQVELRFIEYMPFEARWHHCVPAAQVRARLSQRWTLTPLRTVAGSGPGTGGGPARTWRIEQTGQVVGFISPLSEHFCATCNRLRLTADGHLRTCLAHEDTPSLRDLLRDGASAGDLEQAIRDMVMGKPAGHDCQADGGTVFEGVMTGIGG